MLARFAVVVGLLAAARVGAAAVDAAPVPPAMFAGLHWRQLGPYRAGWATSVAGVPGDPAAFYFGAAGGGVWKTTDAGETWRPLLQHERASAIGALAIAPSNQRILYAGTGQEDSRYDIAAGEGMLRSDDGGESWRAAGLDSTRHIAAILVDPRDPDRVLAAALGHVFGRNAQRGVFLTTDGGRHWRAVLAPGDSIGAIDLAWDPAEPRVVFAATWQMRLHPWMDYFQPQSGPGSGIWRSDDGGERWTRLADGLPPGDLSRIGLAVAAGSRGRIVFASVAAGAPRGRGAAGTSGSGLYRSGDSGAHWQLVNPDAALTGSYFGRLVVAPDDSNTVWVMGRSISVSHDGGRRFEFPKGSPGGDDYHALWIDPRDPRRMISGSDQGAAVTLNGGASWSSWYNQPTGQFYHLGADEQFPYHVYSGQQDNGSVEIASRGAYGAIELRDWHPVGGDERDDMLPKPGDPDVVFGSGLGGGVSRFDEATHQSAAISPWPIGSYGARPSTVRYRYGWITPLAVSPVAPHWLYLGAQQVFRSRDDGQHWDAASGDLTGARAGATPCDDPSPDAARGCGFGVISAIAPSPLAAARLWVGTDDGLIQTTADGGAHWRDVTPPQIPAWGIVFAIDASPFDTASAYAAVDLHRLDRFEPLLLRTHDGGRSWTVITRGLPADEFTSVVRADLKRKGLLYAGTNRAVYVSFDDGDDWESLDGDLPTTWMRDLLPHDGDLLLATQGRGIWSLDDVEPLRELSAASATEDLHLCRPLPAVRLRASESHDTPWPPETPLGENPPSGAVIDYWLSSRLESPVTLTVADAHGRIVRRFSSADPPDTTTARPYFESAWVAPPAAFPGTPGVHRFVWDLRRARPDAPGYHFSIAAVRSAGTPVEPAGPFVLPGHYTLTLSAGARHASAPLEVRGDPRLHLAPGALEAQERLALAIDSTMAEAMAARRAVAAARARAGSALSAALADSLAAVADRGDACFTGVANVLAGISEQVEAADTAPGSGARAVYAACARRVADLEARWHRLESSLPAGTVP
ncbi:MAG TPA: hypothetical protein VMH61_05030 [Candidatus Acidoferrales bacterium]|nr:hypothetical protein [Candidatus Acidoferrales bacterium]